MAGTTNHIQNLLQEKKADPNPLNELFYELKNPQLDIISKSPSLYSNTLFASSLTIAGVDAASTVLGFGGVLIALSPALVALTVALPLFLGGAYFKMKAIQEQREDYAKNIQFAKEIYISNLQANIDNLKDLKKRINETQFSESNIERNQYFNVLCDIKKRIHQQRASYLAAGLPLPLLRNTDPLDILENEISTLFYKLSLTSEQQIILKKLDGLETPVIPKESASFLSTIWKYTIPFLYMVGLAATFALLAGVTAGLFTTLPLTIIPIAVIVGAGIAGYIYKKIEERNSIQQEKNNLLERHNSEMLMLLEHTKSYKKEPHARNDSLELAYENIEKMHNTIELERHKRYLNNLKENASKTNVFSTGLFLSTLAVSGIDSASFVAGYGGGLISTSQFSVILFVAAPLFILGCYFKKMEIDQTRQNYKNALIMAENNYLDQLKIELENLVDLRRCIQSNLSAAEVNHIISKLQRIEMRLHFHEKNLQEIGVELGKDDNISNTSSLIKETIDSMYTALHFPKPGSQEQNIPHPSNASPSQGIELTLWRYALPTFYALCTIATVAMVAGVTAALFSPPAVFITIPAILASGLIGYVYKKNEDRNTDVSNKITHIEKHNHLMHKILEQSQDDLLSTRQHLSLGPHSPKTEKNNTKPEILNAPILAPEAEPTINSEPIKPLRSK